MTYAYVGLGCNSGNCRRQLQTARRLLNRLSKTRLVAMSTVYCSAPLGCPGNQPAYLNAVAELQTGQSPTQLFGKLKKLERTVQKKRRTRNAVRRLDVDYLAHGACRLRLRQLTLPHPRLYQRAFVLQPLADILTTTCRPLCRARVRLALASCRTQWLCRLY